MFYISFAGGLCLIATAGQAVSYSIFYQTCVLCIWEITLIVMLYMEIISLALWCVS